MRPTFIAVAVASLVLVACHGGKKASLPQDATSAGVVGVRVLKSRHMFAKLMDMPLFMALADMSKTG